MNVQDVFGMSGKLADDALVMYDRKTESEWKQPTGTAIAGSLEGARLSMLAAPMVSWERSIAAHPDGVVLQPVRDNGSTGGSPGEIYDTEPYEQYADGTTWDPATGESADGQELERVPARRLFAFAWQDAHGRDAFFEP